MNYLFTETPLKFFVQSLWRDEAFSYLLAKRSIFEILLLTGKDFNPPLYYYILKTWMAIFGSSEIALRTLSLVFFFATIYVSFLILSEVVKLSTKKSFLYLTLLLVNPLLTYYAFEARMYTMFAFLATASWYAYMKKDVKMYQIVITLGLFTHYFMILNVLAQLIHVGIESYKAQKLTLPLKKMFFPFLLFLPWVLFVLTQKIGSSTSFWILAPQPIDALLIPGYLYTGYERVLNFLTPGSTGTIPLVLEISLLLLLFLIIGIRKIVRKHQHVPDYLLALGLWAFFPSVVMFIVSFFFPSFLPRYLIFATVGLLLLCIVVLEHIPVKPRAIVLILLLYLTYAYQQAQIEQRTKAPLDKTISEIKLEARPGDVLYVENELDYFTAQYYFYPERVFIYGENYSEVSPYEGKVLIPENRIIDHFPFYPKKAFILRRNGTYDIKSLF